MKSSWCLSLLPLLIALCASAHRNEECRGHKSRCSRDKHKIAVCRFSTTHSTFETRCVHKHLWANSSLWHSKDYCGGCKVEDRRFCTVESHPCTKFAGKVQVCQYSAFHSNYKTKCIWPETYNITGVNSDRDYCGACRPEDESRCVDEHVLFYDQFNYRSTYKMILQGGWINGVLGRDKVLGNILEWPSDGDRHPQKRFDGIPSDAAYIFVEFDFLEIDNWNGESFSVQIDQAKIELGTFKREVNEGQRSGISLSGIHWKSYSVGAPQHYGFNHRYVDQIHHIVARVPRSFYQADGEVTVKFISDIGHLAYDKCAGVDNVKITAFSFCGGCHYQDQLVVRENFESYNSSDDIVGWTNARLDNSTHFTKFMGRYDVNDSRPEQDPHITYKVPRSARQLFVELDFYQIDGWDGPDGIDLYLGEDLLDFRAFASLIDEGYKGGVTLGGIVWIVDSSPNPPRDLGFGASWDQVHHVKARVPSHFYVDGHLSVRLATRLNGQSSKESSGFDNIHITAEYECGHCMPTKVMSMETFEDGKVQNTSPGWVNGKVERSEPNSSLTMFLGRYDVDSKHHRKDPVKVWFVEPSAPYSTIEFDFFEIDQWEMGDCIHVHIQNIFLNIGVFSMIKDEKAKSGSNEGIKWKIESKGPPAQLGFGPYPDQIHHFTAYVPSSLYKVGLLQIRLSTRINGTADNESAGYDNFRITSFNDCGPCVPEMVLVSETFEDKWIDGWDYGRLDYGTNFSHFLGRYGLLPPGAKTFEDPAKTFTVPPTAESLILEFDLYEIGNWRYPDCAYAHVNGKDGLIALNFFDGTTDDGSKGNITNNGIVWTSSSKGPPVDLGFNGSIVDQIHHVVATIPSSVYQNGKLHIKLSTRLNSTSSTVAAGWDNLKITGTFDCDYPSAAPSRVPTMTGRPTISSFPSLTPSVSTVPSVSLPPSISSLPSSAPSGKIIKEPTLFAPAFMSITGDSPIFTPAMSPSFETNGKKPNDGGFNFKTINPTPPGNVGGSDSSPIFTPAMSPSFDQTARPDGKVPTFSFRTIYPTSGIPSASAPSNSPSPAIPTVIPTQKSSTTPSDNPSPALSDVHLPSGVPSPVPSEKASDSVPVNIVSEIPSGLAPLVASFVPSNKVSLSPSGPVQSSPYGKSESTVSSHPTEGMLTGCRDANEVDFFVNADYPKANCLWLASRPDMIIPVCGKSSVAYVVCPITCGRC